MSLQHNKKTSWMTKFFGTFRYSGRTVRMVWETSGGLTLLLACLTVVAGLLPGVMAYIGKMIVDAVVLAAKSGAVNDRWVAVEWVGLEALLIALLTLVQRGIAVVQSLMRALLGQRVNEVILEKSLTLELKHFEDAEFYDKINQARRGASSRPLSLVNRTFTLFQHGISLVTYGYLLWFFSGWAVVILILAALPAFFSETFFSEAAFRLFQWQTQEKRQQNYLEIMIAREDYVKEVKLFQLGDLFLQRYKDIFSRMYLDDRNLTLRKGLWGYLLGLVGSLAFYATYGWIAWNAAVGRITLGEMTMYLLVFKQGQNAVSASLRSIGGMFEDNLYLVNLYEFLDETVQPPHGNALAGAIPGDGLRFEQVSFVYPGSDTPALDDVSFHLKPGEKLALVGENGSGKTTLIKLLTRLYQPTTGRILLDGTDLQTWNMQALRERVGVIFQDYVRYQLLVGENIGVGDVSHFMDEQQWASAAKQGMADTFIQDLPKGYHTQLGRWFKDGRELSIGQWQKIALSRAFMRQQADILVLDEPTSAMDAEAEAQIFEHFRKLTASQMVILISHRFSTVRMADQIAVLHQGQLLEMGSHPELMQQQGRYAHLFSLQAAGYM